LRFLKELARLDVEALDDIRIPPFTNVNAPVPR